MFLSLSTFIIKSTLWWFSKNFMTTTECLTKENWYFPQQCNHTEAKHYFCVFPTKQLTYKVGGADSGTTASGSKNIVHFTDKQCYVTHSLGMSTAWISMELSCIKTWTLKIFDSSKVQDCVHNDFRPEVNYECQGAFWQMITKLNSGSCTPHTVCGSYRLQCWKSWFYNL